MILLTTHAMPYSHNNANCIYLHHYHLSTAHYNSIVSINVIATFCCEMKMAMYHSDVAPSDADSRKVIGQHFVCCLLIWMFDHYTTEQWFILFILWWKVLKKSVLEWCPCSNLLLWVFKLGRVSVVEKKFCHISSFKWAFNNMHVLPIIAKQNS